MPSLTRRVIELNRFVSGWFDHHIIPAYSVDGMTHFTEEFMPGLLRPNERVFDVGAGRGPLVSREEKDRLKLHYTGLDISQEELDHSPPGVYDETICADITSYRGHADADLIICRAVLEHVKDVEGAFAAFSSILKPGGRVTLFVPGRNAPYARLNLLLGEEFKRKLLFSLYPQTHGKQGFKSYYDRCTPSQFRKLALDRGFSLLEQNTYVYSFYTGFVFPLHVSYRLGTIAMNRLFGEDFVEGFSMCLQKDVHA